MKVFTRWEIDLFYNYMEQPPFHFFNAVNSPVVVMAIKLEMDFTVNELRQVIGTPAPHPDGNPLFGSSPNRGNMYVWEAETARPGDSVIPALVKVTYGVPGVGTCTIGGTVTPGDILTLTVINANLSGGQQDASYTVQGGDTLTLIAAGLKSAVNAITGLEAAGIWAMSYYSATLISCGAGTTFGVSTSGGSTETLTLS